MSLPLLLMSGAGPFPVQGVDFDGTNDYMGRNTVWTGATSGSKGSVSLWLRLDGGNDNTLYILEQDLRTNIYRNTSNKLHFDLLDSGATQAFRFETSNTLTSGAAWINVLASWDTNFTAGNKLSHLYINDVSDKIVTSDTNGAFDINYVTNNHYVGSNAGSTKLDGCLAYFWYAPNQYIDFSSVANRRKFITASKRPVFLGVAGSKPTGIAPIVFFHVAMGGAAADFSTNLGTGGNMTITGTLDLSSSNP